MKSDAFLRPLTCPVWMRPIVFLGRVFFLQPRTAVVTTFVVVVLGILEGVGLGLLLPLLALIGVDTGTRADGPTEVVKRTLVVLGIPLTLEAVLAVFLAVGLVHIALHAAQRYLAVRSGEAVTMLVRCRVFDASSHASWSAIASGHGAYLVNAVVSEATRIGLIFGNTITAFGLVFNFLIYVSLAACLSWRFTLLTAAIGILTMVILRWIYRSSRRFGAHTSSATNRMQEILNEHISAAKFIRGLGVGAWSRTTFAKAARAVGRYVRRNQANTVLVKTSVEPIGLLLLVSIIYLSVSIVRLPAAELILLLVIFYRIIPRLATLQEMLQRIFGMLPAYEAVSEMLQRLDASREREGGLAFSGLSQGIELRGVWIRHGDNHLLKGADLIFPALKTIALVGSSGGGKTTILDVISGVLIPDSGVVLVDGVSLRNMDLTAFRRRIGIVPQESVFFHDSIAVTMRIAASNATETGIWEALAAAYADEFVRNTEHGLETMMGDQGVRFSGGERQRLALARALLRKPEILLLDEPSSALDVESENAIRATLANLRGKITIVVISHRTALTLDADIVYRIEDGRVVQVVEPVRSSSKG